MIMLSRARTKATIAVGLRGAKRIDKCVLLLEGMRDGNLKFTSKNSYWSAAKKQLKLESYGKCAYCESRVPTVAHGDVEHFRPKATYWWLAYCYDNYLFSCQICNQIYKSDSFPIYGPPLAPDPLVPTPLPAGLTEAQLRVMAAQLAPDRLDDAQGYPMATFLAAAKKEKPGLVDPYTVDPEPFFKWVEDATLKEVSIAPRDSKPATIRAFDAVQKYLGLNREELRKERWLTYELVDGFRQVLAAASIPGDLQLRVKAIIKEMMMPKAPYAAMVRYFVNDVWHLNLG